MTVSAPLQFVLCALALVSSTVPAAAQMLPGDLLLNSFTTPDLLVHYRPDGTIVQTSSQGTGYFWQGAAILPNGDWATTRKPDGVNIFDGITGVEIATWDLPKAFGFGGGMDVFSDGTLAIVDRDGKIWRTDIAGNVITFWKMGGKPAGVFVDEQDHVWTSMIGGRVIHTDGQGNMIHEFPVGSKAGDITMADDGTLFVNRFQAGKVAHFSQDGTFLGDFVATQGAHNYTLAMGIDQTLWTSEQHDTLLYNYDLDGNLLGSFDVGPATAPLFLNIMEAQDEDLGNNYCGPANLNSTGLSGVISAFGRPEALVNRVTLTATQLPVNVFGYFLNSDVQGFTPFPPGSQGNLCLAGAIGRHVKQVANSGAAGELVIDVDLTALPRPGGTHSVVAGETWNFQCWFRDVNPGPTSNFTDGISVTFL